MIVFVLAVIVPPMLLMMFALIDVGQLGLMRTRAQFQADAVAHAAGASLAQQKTASPDLTPSPLLARSAAEEIATANNVDMANVQLDVQTDRAEATVVAPVPTLLLPTYAMTATARSVIVERERVDPAAPPSWRVRLAP